MVYFPLSLISMVFPRLECRLNKRSEISEFGVIHRPSLNQVSYIAAVLHKSESWQLAVFTLHSILDIPVYFYAVMHVLLDL